MSTETNPPQESGTPTNSRRDFLKNGSRAMVALGVAGGAVAATSTSDESEMVWQIDPTKCTMCGNCATACVLSPSAVKCVHAYDVCGYCKLCGGYHNSSALVPDTAAENMLCPTDAIVRTFIEDPYYEYSIDEDLCIGCAKCVKGCDDFGNGSLYLQIRHNICVNCNQCAIANVCEGDAISRVPASAPYPPKGDHFKGLRPSPPTEAPQTTDTDTSNESL